MSTIPATGTSTSSSEITGSTSCGRCRSRSRSRSRPPKSAAVPVAPAAPTAAPVATVAFLAVASALALPVLLWPRPWSRFSRSRSRFGWSRFGLVAVLLVAATLRLLVAVAALVTLDRRSPRARLGAGLGVRARTLGAGRVGAGPVARGRLGAPGGVGRAVGGTSCLRPTCSGASRFGDSLRGAVGALWPPDWAARMASTSWAFFMLPAPLIPRPPAICLSSGSSLLLSPPPVFLSRGGSVQWLVSVT